MLVTSRRPEHLSDLAASGATLYRLDLAEPSTLAGLRANLSPGVRVLHSVPTASPTPDAPPADPTPRLLEILGPLPARLVYLSTTGVYGETALVDETTPVAPVTANQQARVEAEKIVAGGSRSSLILRPAGIYGPGRGVHVSMREGRYRLSGDGSNFISRIQVDDLAALAEAGLLADGVTGAYPVADTLPAPAREVASFVAELLHLPMPPMLPPQELHETLRANRQVDGRAILQALGLELLYPTYREGIVAALAAENPLP